MLVLAVSLLAVAVTLLAVALRTLERSPSPGALHAAHQSARAAASGLDEAAEALRAAVDDRVDR